MRYLIRETLYTIAALCSIYAVGYMFVVEDWRCQVWAIFAAFLVVYMSYKVMRVLLKRKNAEIKAIAKRKRELEIAVLGEARRSSDYNPDKHDF